LSLKSLCAKGQQKKENMKKTKQATEMKRILLIPFAGLLLAGLGQAKAGLVYDNGPINGGVTPLMLSIVAYELPGIPTVSDSFTVSSATSLTSAQIAIWHYPSYPMSSVDWSIGTTPFGSDISSGTASSIQTPYSEGTPSGWEISEADFGISGSVAAGTTYYFTLQDAVAAFGPVSWDVNYGPSVAYYQCEGYQQGPYPDTAEPPDSESFQLYGTSSLPEPTTIISGALMLLPFGASSLRFLRKRQGKGVMKA
jgi:hypothetical protein